MFNNSVCKYCESMDFGCLSCIGENQCLICKTGYYLDNGQCTLCNDLFKGCMVCTAYACQVCKSNYFQDMSSTPPGSCVACSDSISGCNLC
jgi:hypothetical protein